MKRAKGIFEAIKKAQENDNADLCPDVMDGI